MLAGYTSHLHLSEEISSKDYEAVVEDGNLITSRTPKDMTAFLKAIINHLK